MKTYIHYGHTKFDKNMFTRIRNSTWMPKPEGGLWASDIKAVRGWKDWCEAEQFRDCKEDDSFSFTLSDSAKVLYISSVEDLKSLPKVKSEFGSALWVLLDFEKLAETYDAVEVSISSDFDLYFELYGWDCDSILIMNPDVVVA